jgi:hypothetical protein
MWDLIIRGIRLAMPEILDNIILDCESIAGREPGKVK